MRSARVPFLAAAAVLGSVPALAAGPAPGEEGVAVTVYSTPGSEGQTRNVYDRLTGQWITDQPGFSIVKERRKIPLEAGRTPVRFDDVAARIDGSTVHFRSLTDPAGTAVLEQGFEYDLASASRILERYVGREITVQQRDAAPVVGTLLSFDGGQIVIGLKGGVRIVRRDESLRDISCGELPGGLVTKPTLAWLVQAAKAGEHLVEATYETSGMGWNADYTAVISADEKTADLSSWVTIRNLSGATYRDAALKLVAGDVNRAPAEEIPRRRLGAMAKGAEVDGAGFAEKAFFEYHLYTLGRRTTIPDRSLKQIELFDPVAGVPVRKVFLYDGLRDLSPWGGGAPNDNAGFGNTGSRKVAVFFEIENRRQNGLGIPLPAGRIRVHKRDEADGLPELIGEDRIDHTPKDEKVRLRMGDAFDVVGERKQTDFRSDRGARWIRESFEIRVRNHKTEPVEVIVAERLYRWLQWEIEQKSQDFAKVDAQLVHFPVRVAPDGEAVVSYTVKYTW